MPSKFEMEADAEALFEAFHDVAPRPNQIVQIAPIPNVFALEVGRLDAVMYSIEGEAKPLFNRFSEKNQRNRPRLFVSFDGRQIYILRGVYRFTEEGFVE